MAIVDPGDAVECARNRLRGFLFDWMAGGGMSHAHFRVEPAVHQLLQTRLAAKMLYRGVMRHHVFPGIDLEHLPFRGLGMGTVGLGPGQPPVVDGPLLLAADIAIESFGPGHRRHPIQRSCFLHEGSLHRASGATRAILCHFAALE